MRLRGGRNCAGVPMRSNGFAKLALVASVALLGLMVVPASVASAAPGIMVPCLGSGGGTIGLIAAINTANLSGGGTINLASGCTYPLTTVNNVGALGSNGLPRVTSKITVNGNGATIARTAGPSVKFRILEVDGPSGNLTLSALTVTGGMSPGGGGGLLNDEGTLTLNHTQVTGNTAVNGPGGGIASGIGPDHPGDIGPIGVLTLNNSAVNGNSAPNTGGGGIINFAGTVVLNSSQVNNNTALNGGGIASGNGNGGDVANSSLTLNGSQVDGNTATGGLGGPGAGGIANAGSAVLNSTEVNNNTAPGGWGGGIVNHGTMTISKSAVNGNTGPTDSDGNFGLGGGIINVNFDAPGSGILTINNSQINGNSVPDGFGGGILNGLPFTSPSALTIHHSQVSGNTAAEGGGIANLGSVTLATTAVTANNPDNCFPTGTIVGCTG